MPPTAGDRWILDLTYRIARYERLALSHAFSMHRYGSPQNPYAVSSEYAGDLAVQLLNRTYAFFAAHVRRAFMGTTYFYIEDYHSNRDLVLPLANVRVPKNVYIARAHVARAQVTFNSDHIRLIPPHVAHTYGQYGAMYFNPTPAIGDILVHLCPHIVQDAFEVLPWWVDMQDADQQEFSYFWGMPAWRTIPKTWGENLQVPLGAVIRPRPIKWGTQSVMVASLNVDAHGIDVIGNLPMQTFVPRQMLPERKASIPLQDAALPPNGYMSQPYLLDAFPLYSSEGWEAGSNEFAIASENLSQFPGSITNLTGGHLILRADEGSNLSGSYLIGINGEISFRPAIGLDCSDPRIAPNAIDLNNPPDPFANRLTPLMLYPLPTFEQLFFLENYFIPVAQYMYIAHMSADDNRYEAEMRTLQQFIASMSIEPGSQIRSKL